MLRPFHFGMAGRLLALWPLLSAAEAQVRDEDLFVRPEDQRYVLFGSVEAGRSVFASGGFKQALTGPLDRTGFVAVESGGAGVTRERVRLGDDSLAATRLTTHSNLLGGHQWGWPGLFVTALAGLEIQHEQLTIDGRVLRFSKPRYGVRAEGEIWSNPTDATLLTASTVLNSARGSLWGARLGGPEGRADALRGTGGLDLRHGHLSRMAGRRASHGLRAGLLQGRLSAGWAATNDGRPGSPYFGATAWFRL